jgi:hypothetical protein
VKNTGQPITPGTTDPEAQFVLDTGEATVDDGWQITGAYAVTERGVVITRLFIEPSPSVIDDSGKSRDRLAHEIPSRGIDTRVLGLIKFRRLRSELGTRVRIKAKLAGLEKELPHLRNMIDTAKAQAAKLEDRKTRVSGRKPADPSTMAAYAEAFLEEATAPGSNYRARLSKRWSIGIEGVDSRKKLLQKQGWIQGPGRAAAPGPMLYEWQIAHRSEGDN